MNARRFTAVLGALALAISLAACGSSKSSASKSSVQWPAPSDPMARARAAGLVPETAERLEYHVHSHLDVFVNGVPLVVPAGIGIDTNSPGVHASSVGGAPAFGGITVPCDEPCISPLHTHDVTGVIHTESATRKGNTLGQLFVEWDVRLDANCVAAYCKPKTPVAIYVNGAQFSGDPRTIPLIDLTEIAVVIGTPPAQIPTQWSPK